MRWTFLVLLFNILIGICAIENTEETTKGNVQEMQGLDREGWKVMKSEESNEWIPQEQPQEYRLIRRRLRKRKKRPPTTSIDSPDDGSPYERPLRRRVRPYLSNENYTPYDVSQEDSVNPYIRRRLPPRLPIPDELTPVISHKPSDEDENNDTNANNKKSSQPQQIPDPDLSKSQDSQNYISDIKFLLKQTPSLSEVLQQKNLSLIELLNGDKEALFSITQKPFITNKKQSEIKKNSQKENDNKLLGNGRVKETTDEHFTVNGISQNKYDSSKQIVVKPHIDSDQNIEKINSINRNPLSGGTIDINISSSEKNLPKTNAKIRNTLKFKKTASNVNKDSSNPIKINLSDVIGFDEIAKHESVTKEPVNEEVDKPFRVKIDLNATSVNEKPITEETASSIYVTAREEIMEVLKDPKTREKMSKILEKRNMTIEELVEQRERGSSQIHLADIFHNNSMEPEPQEEVLVGVIQSDNIIAHSERQQKSRVFEDKAESKNIRLEQIPEIISINITNTLPSKNVTVHLESSSKKTLELKTSEKDLQDQQEEHRDRDFSNPLDLFSEIPNVESMEDTISISSNDNLNYKELFKEDDDNILSTLPSGVKSAIFVSLAIIGLSIVVFLTILIIFKWSQLKHRKINYCNSLTSKFRSPILQGTSTSAIRTFVNETLGRRKNYYKNNVQKICDDIWEGDNVRKLSF